MALRGKAPEERDQRLRLMVYGDKGSGKTYCSLGFPSPYLIDTEKSAVHKQYTKKLKESNGSYFETTDFFDMWEEVKELMRTKHNYKTLVIDSISPLYYSLVEWCENKITKNAKDPEKALGFNAANKLANRYFQRFYLFLTKLDMNIVFTSREKDKWLKVGSESTNAAGETIYDCSPNSGYEFDLVLKVQSVGKNKIAKVEKTRIEGFELFEQFDFTYEQIAAKYDKNILEKDFVPFDIVSAETLVTLKNAFKRQNYSQEQIKGILSKNNLSSFSELSEAKAVRYIEQLKIKEASENVRV